MITIPVSENEKISNKTIETALVMAGKAADDKAAVQVRESMGNEEIRDLLTNMTGQELIQAMAGGPGKTGIPLSHIIIDGTVIPGDLSCVVESGDYNKVPIIVGANEDEFGSLLPLLPSLKKGMPNYAAGADIIEGKKTLADVLPTEADREFYKKAVYYGAHLYYRSPFVSNLARSLTKHQKGVFAYSFNYGQEDVRGDVGFIYRAGHSSELPFFQGYHDNPEITKLANVQRGFGPESLPGRIALNEAIMKYQGNFFHTGNPNGSGSNLPLWQEWSSSEGGPKAMILDADLNKTRIEMSSADIPTVAAIRKALDAEDPKVREEILFLVGIITSPALYEKGDYNFPNCQ